jgi:hypothetical protein
MNGTPRSPLYVHLFLKSFMACLGIRFLLRHALLFAAGLMKTLQLPKAGDTVRPARSDRIHPAPTAPDQHWRGGHQPQWRPVTCSWLPQ